LGRFDHVLKLATTTMMPLLTELCPFVDDEATNMSALTGFGIWFTTSLIPAFSPRRRRTVRRLSESSRDWIYRTAFHQPETVRRVVLSWGERKQVRAGVKDKFILHSVNRPSQNKHQRRISVCRDQISVIARPHAQRRRFGRSADCPNPQHFARQTTLKSSQTSLVIPSAASWDNSRSAAIML
jgi:hypothetical protein